ncbi:MAG: response regulator [Candidatus Limnocylindrales bacterium]
MIASSGAAATGALASDSARQTPVKRLLLVVEDNPGDARLLREMLHAQGSHDSILTHVESMGEAERYLASGTVDVILLDLGLPDAQGLDAVRRAHTAAPHIPLVVLTGLDDESLAVQALQEGAQDYLIKGQIESRSLLRALRYAIERKILEDGRRAGESQLLQAQKLESVGRLAGGIAHDFNNMLFAISGYAELLTQDLVAAHPSELDRSGLLHSVKAISDAAKRAGALTGQLLAFSRQQMVVAQVVDMNAAITTIAPMIRQLIGEHLRLTLDLDPGAGRILADPSQIDQILVNLVVNARDAMPGGGTVTIKTGTASASHADLADLVTDAASFVSMEVTDTGVGMDLKTREHMFEPFFTTKDIGKGTGLGLATTHGIVDQAGGRIRVRSEPGQGSTFRLLFPRVTETIEDGPAIQIMHVARVGRVLVVEDDAAVREMVGRLLERAGYEVLEATDGVEAMAVTRLKPPLDAIVTDVVMPNMSGVALAEAMIERYPSIGVVLLSGYTPDHLDLERVTAQGATFVAKPVSAAGLMQAVQVAVDASRIGRTG